VNFYLSMQGDCLGISNKNILDILGGAFPS
jgi:hypothetical protein